MADAASISDSNDTTSMCSRSTSKEPSALNLQISIATPRSVKTELEASKARSLKRKAAVQAEDHASKNPKTNADGTPFKNRGGRPRKENPTPPRQPKGPLRLRVSKPVKVCLPPELWKLVIEQSSPALLLRARILNRNFYYGLTNGEEQSSWTKARKLTYGEDHPNPPTGVDEIQYADLLEGQGCQGCKNPKTRKTYWCFLRRWCEECLDKRVVSEEKADEIMYPHSHWRGCVPQAVQDSWNHYQWLGTRESMPPWAKYQKHAHIVYLVAGPEGLEKLKAKINAFLEKKEDGTTKTPSERDDFIQGIREDMVKKMDERRKVEDWEAYRRLKQRDERKSVQYYRGKDIVQEAAKMTPSIPPADLEKLQAYKNALQIAKPLSKRSWQELEPKLAVQFKKLQAEEALAAEEAEAARREVEAAQEARARDDRSAELEGSIRAANKQTASGEVSNQPVIGHSGPDGVHSTNAIPFQMHGSSMPSWLSVTMNSDFASSQSGTSSNNNNNNNDNSSSSSLRHLPPLNAFWPRTSHSLRSTIRNNIR